MPMQLPMIDRVPDENTRLRRCIDQIRQAIADLAAGADTLPLTTKGDLLSRTTADLARLAVGNDGDVLFSDSTQSIGLRWGPAFGGGGNPLHPFPYSGLLEWWPLDEASGSRVGKLGNILSLASGAVGSSVGTIYPLAAQFTGGSGNFLKLVTTDIQVQATGFTVACWVYLDSAPPGNNTGRAYAGRWGGSTHQFLILSEKYSAGTISEVRYLTSINGSSFLSTDTNNVQLSTGAWHLVVGTSGDYNAGGNRSQSLYTDAAISTDGVGLTGGIITTGDQLEVGGLTGSVDYTMDGRIGPIGFWNRPLTLPEISSLFYGAKY